MYRQSPHRIPERPAANYPGRSCPVQGARASLEAVIALLAQADSRAIARTTGAFATGNNRPRSAGQED